MVTLNNAQGKNFRVDTSGCQLVMYKAINWIPPHFFGYDGHGPEILMIGNTVYELKDKDTTNIHYEAVNGEPE